MTLPAQSHSATSVDAAESFASEAPALRERVLQLFREAWLDGRTDDELFTRLRGYSQSSIRPRRIELVDAGLVLDSGRSRTTRSGRAATVWVLADAARGQMRLDLPNPRSRRA